MTPVLAPLVLALATLAAAPPAQAERSTAHAPARKQRMAVIDASVTGAATAGLPAGAVAAEVARFGFEVVSPSDVGAGLGPGAQERIRSCAQQPRCLAAIGAVLGVDFVVSGDVVDAGARLRLSLVVVDASRAKLVTRLSSSSERDGDALARSARAAVPTLVSAIRGDALPPPPIAAAPRPWTRSRRTAVASWGASAVLLAGGIASGLAARSRYDDLRAHQGEPGYDHLWADRQGGIRALGVTADVLLGSALAAGAFGTWVWFRSDREIALVPTAASGAGGVAVRGRF